MTLQHNLPTIQTKQIPLIPVAANFTMPSCRPLLKWPGGKTSDLPFIESRIPPHQRYFEPFFGGGSVFFHAIDAEIAYANDLHPDLMAFYERVQNQCVIFFELLDRWVAEWENANLEERNCMYYEVRERYNTRRSTTAERAVDFFLLRELAYGGMFRVNSNGDFNVPFGRAYARNKNMRGKINRLRSFPVKAKLSCLRLHTGDFDEFLDNFDFDTDDFMFVDPPYDSSFSQYDRVDFSVDDQRRLARRLRNFNGLFMLVCKLTPLIEELYLHHSDFQVFRYQCRYRFNIKGRFSRNAIHVVVTNYDPDF